MKKLFALLLFLTTPAFAATYYISPAGNDANAGTQASPWRTIQKGHDVAVAGDIVYVRGGTYILSKEIAITRDGVEGSPIQLLAYPGELPVLDGISMTNSGDSDIRLGKPIKMLGANWWIIDGFEVKRGPGGGVIISEASNKNIIRRLKVHHNGRLSSNNGSGILLHDRSSYNLIENCDSYNNRDDKGSKPGGDADGFGFVLVGPGNVIQGNRAWQNSDDGYDAFNNPNGVTFEGNWAWQNGYNAALANAGGNGDGFKLGGGSTSGSNLYTNNLSWANKQHGFDNNTANRPSTLYNNAAWTNDMTNFVFSTNVASVLRNNLSYAGRYRDALHTGVDESFNSWNLPVTVTTADFASLTFTVAAGPRNSDGSLPVSGFLHLVQASDLIDKGVSVGLPYSGSSPDLGAYEQL